MNSIDIYATLFAHSNGTSSSIHYLKRYVKYIVACKAKNVNLTEDEYYEYHHIIPKALNPEFKNLKANPWNKAILTARQHGTAHWILARALGGSMWYALNMMFVWCEGKHQQRYFNPRIYGEVRTNLTCMMKEYAQTPEGRADYIARHAKVKATKTEQGIYASAGKVLSQTLKTVNCETGLTIAQERSQRIDWDAPRETLGGRTLREFGSQRVSGENNPAKIDGVGVKISSTLKEHYKDKQGTFNGKVHTDETKLKQSQAKLGENNATTGTVWANNGTTQLRVPADDIPEGFVVGRLSFTHKKQHEERTCPHCNKTGKGGNMERYHFNNCKSRDIVQLA